MPYHQLVQLSSVPIWAAIANVLGDVLWIVAYVLIIRRSFTDRTYGMPMLCVALNFTWEFIYAVQFPFRESIVVELLRWAWLVTDVVIVYQLFRYGRDNQMVPLIKQYFYPICVAMFVSAYLGQLAVHYSFFNDGFKPDRLGYTNGYIINLVMSMLFISMYFSRPNLQGLSVGAAWAKMLGTGILSAASFISMTDWQHNWQVYCFRVYLYATVFIFDVIYIRLLYRQRAVAADHSEEPGMLAAA